MKYSPLNAIRKSPIYPDYIQYRLAYGLTLGAKFNGGWSTGIIGPQTAYFDGTNYNTRGNHFVGWGGGAFAISSMHSINSNAMAYAYEVNFSFDPDPPSSPFTTELIPPFVGLTAFFPTDPGYNHHYECPLNCITPHPAPHDKDKIPEYLQSLSGNSTEYGDQTDHLKWCLRQELLQAIKRDTSLLDSFPVLQQFYDTIPNSSEGKFSEVKELISSLQDSSTTTDSSAKEEIIQQAESKNNSVNGIMIYEYNRKVINTVTLETVSRNNFNFSEQLKETVESIAFQCPYVGGTAVFEARAIMQNWNDSVYFDDYNLCNGGSYFRVASERNGSKFNYLSIFPNPASTQITINYILQNEESALLNVRDLTSRIVYSKKLTASSGQLQIPTSNLISGSYLLEITDNSKQVLRGKFNIIQ